jgi:hypothetical protein
MKTLFTIILSALGICAAPAAFMSNPFTTNNTPTALNIVSNIATINTNKLVANGALLTNSFLPWVDAYGSAGSALLQANQYTDDLFALNDAGWITTSATNDMTRFKTNVVTSISLGTGLSGSVSLDSGGYHWTIQATGTNNTSITNLNPTVLANAGGLTTNNYTSYADAAGAAVASTNQGNIVFTNNPKFANALTNPAAFDASGLALAATNRGNIRFTNNPVISGFVVTSNLVVSSSTNSRGEVTLTVGSQPGVVAGVYQPLTNNLFQWSLVSTSQVPIGNNIIATLAPGTNISLVATTNLGLVTVTINSSSPTNAQTASTNLNSWSGINTNVIILSTNLVNKVTAGSGMTVTASTNAAGINYTVAQTTSPPTYRAGTFTASAGGSGSVTFSPTMGSTPIITFAQEDWGANASGKSYVIITARSATGFSWSNANDTSGLSKTIDYIAILPQ